MPGAVPVRWPDIARQTPAPASSEETVLIRERMEEIKERNEVLEIRNDRLTARNEYLVDQLLKRSGIEPADFLQAISETPIPTDRLVIEGFQIRSPKRFRPDVRDTFVLEPRFPLYAGLRG